MKHPKPGEPLTLDQELAIRWDEHQREHIREREELNQADDTQEKFMEAFGRHMMRDL